ncbi:MAG: hypothetical protein LUE98_02055 [Tannerellaceae bacterium]|nr:hypothetical protein [Tannerellaceae bacterium]
MSLFYSVVPTALKFFFYPSTQHFVLGWDIPSLQDFIQTIQENLTALQ